MGGSSATAPLTPTGPSSSQFTSADLRLNILGKLAAARALSLPARGNRLEQLAWLESGEPFAAAGVIGLLDGIPAVADWATPDDVTAMQELLRGAPCESLDAAVMKTLPRRERHRSGAYFTPRWLAEHVLDRAGFDGGGAARLLDPMCGAGIFMVAALERLRAARPRCPAGELLGLVAGIEKDPVSALAARVAVLACVAARITDPVRIPVSIGDAMAPGADADLPRDQFDIVAGNPPWIGWESLSAETRALTRPLWERHGLFTPAGSGSRMETLLGRGRKDLCMLATYVAADRWLRDGGRLSFVIAQAVFKTVGSAAGFRKLRLGDGTPLGVIAVDDFSGRRVFPGAASRACVLTLEKGKATQWPVAYMTYSAKAEPQRAVAEPIDPADAGSAWITAAPERLGLLRRVLGPSGYVARAGAYTGGANGVFWVRMISRHEDGSALVENLPESGKRALPRVRARIELALLYPLLRASDLSRDDAAPRDWILMPQDPVRRRGIDESTMREEHPLALAWLEQFRAELALRRDRGTRSLIASGAPFYSIFSVSRATLSPWKVVWARIASSVRAVPVGPLDGRPVVPQETCTFIPCESSQPELEAHFLAGLLSSPAFNEAACAFAQVGGKSFGAPHLLRHIAVPRFNPEDAAHRSLADQMRRGPPASESLMTATEPIWSRAGFAFGGAT